MIKGLRTRHIIYLDYDMLNDVNDNMKVRIV